MPGQVASLAATVDDLVRVIDRLESLVTTDPQRADLRLLRATAGRLHRQPAALRHFEPARFRRLLELAGPQNAPELLLHLSEDLSSARESAERAARSGDWPTLRGASHVLISLSGSVGALSLQDLSERLNAAAHRHDEAATAALIGETLAELDCLIDIVAATPAERPRP